METRERSLSEERAHHQAILAIVDRWMAGEITLAQKREEIIKENTWFRGHSVRGRTGRLITAEPAERTHVIADEDDREEWWQR